MRHSRIAGCLGLVPQSGSQYPLFFLCVESIRPQLFSRRKQRRRNFQSYFIVLFGSCTYYNNSFPLPNQRWFVFICLLQACLALHTYRCQGTPQCWSPRTASILAWYYAILPVRYHSNHGLPPVYYCIATAVVAVRREIRDHSSPWVTPALHLCW